MPPAAAPATLYHLVPQAAWEAAKASGGLYFPPTYAQDGFTHLCADADSLLGIANHFYADCKGDWLLLSLSPSRLVGELRWEPAAAVGTTPAHTGDGAQERQQQQLFPHLYGGLAPCAVTEETLVDRLPSGKFVGLLWGVTVVSTRGASRGGVAGGRVLGGWSANACLQPGLVLVRRLRADARGRARRRLAAPELARCVAGGRPELGRAARAPSALFNLITTALALALRL